MVPIGRRLGGSKRQETVCYAEVGGWLVPRDGLGDTERYAGVCKTGWFLETGVLVAPRGMRLVGTRCLCYRC